MSDKENLTDLLGQVFRNRQAEIKTSMPGTIVSYDYTSQKAQVKPTIKRLYADGRSDEYPVISNVPIMFQRSGGAGFTFPVKEGDSVLLVFAERSIDSYMDSGSPDQTDNRMHSLNDAIAIPGLYPFSAQSPAENNTDVLLSYAGAKVAVTEDGQIKMTSPVKVTIDSPQVYMTGDLVTKGNIFDVDTAEGTFQNFREVYNSHVHAENDNGGPTDPPEQQI